MSTGEVSKEVLMKEALFRYAAAYFESECIHKELCSYLAASEFASVEEVTKPRFQEALRRAWSLTLGRIVKQLAEPPPSSLMQEFGSDLDEAVVKRNFLAHDYWIDGFAKVLSREGLEEMILELTPLFEWFRALHARLHPAVGAHLHDRGVTEEMMKSWSEVAIQQRGVGPFPAQRFPRKQERVVKAWREVVNGGQARLYFETDDGCLWQLCGDGLGWPVVSQPDPKWEIEETIQKHLPATLDPRPAAATPWNYEFQLPHHVALWVSKQDGTDEFRWGLRDDSTTHPSP